MKHTIKLLTLAFMLASILTLTGCPGPVNNYIEPVHEHVWTEVTTEYVAPTCTTKGSKTYVCTLCGETKVEELDALGHNFGEWIVTTEETCTADGEETAEIDALGHDYQGGYCEREGCTDPWEHSNIKDIRVYSSEAAFRNDYGSSTSTTNAIRGVPYETLHFSFEKEVSNVKMPLNTLLHLKSDYSGYKVKEYGIGDGEDDAVSKEYTDPNKEVALTNLAALLIEPITN